MIRIIISCALFGAALGVIGFGALGLPGKISHRPPVEIYSDQFMPGMDKQPKLRPQKPDSFFSNGISSQLPPEGTVARGEATKTTDGDVYSFEDSPVNTGRIVGGTNFVEIGPLPVDLALLERGQSRFDIYCAPCHGRLGDGNGVTKVLGVMPAVANLHDKRIVEMTDGEIFNTITHGKGLMGAAGPLVPTNDRWAIIAYLRALQLSQLDTVNDLTPEQQAVLNK